MQKTSSNTVWDLPTRLFHWLLTIAIVAQWATAELGSTYMDWHFYIGYFTLGLILFRLVWGIIGSKYARFSNFIRSPKAIWHYVSLLIRGKPPTFIGHNPLGGLIVPVVIVIVGLQAISGLFASDDILYSGPYSSSVSNQTQSWLDSIHHWNFDLITIIVLAHILAILVYTLWFKKTLIRPMLHGKKDIASDQRISTSKLISAVILACSIAAFVYWLVVLAAPPVEEFYY